MIIDDALARIDPELARRYPGIAASRDSLLRRRDQLLAMTAPTARVTFVTAAGVIAGNPGIDFWQPVLEARHLLAATYRLVFASVNASAASTTPIWPNEGVNIEPSWSSETTAVAPWALPV